jgi:hypothetical protein
MQNKELISYVLILVLCITTIIFVIRSSTNAAREQEAEQMSTVLISKLKAEGYHVLYTQCRSLLPGDFPQLERCLEDAKSTQDLSKLFKEDRFSNVDAKAGKDGYLVIENAQGGRTFASANFTLRQNNVEVASGCTTPGDIAPGFTCRFDFTEYCEPGDNLEILYDGKRAHLKTC